MKTIKRILSFILISVVLNSCEGDTVEAELNIIETAGSKPELSTFLIALQSSQSNLITTLSNSGPFTVLAPSNQAFTNYLNANNYASINDIPPSKLIQILFNHVIAANVAANVFEGFGAGYTSTLAEGPNNSKVSIYFNASSGIRFNGISTITTRDLVATNGVIHIVDTVIDLPTVTTFVLSNPNYSALLQALTTFTPATDFASILSRTEGQNNDDINPNFTVFAPNNSAFAALPSIPNEDELTPILLHHVADEINLRTMNFTQNGNTTINTLHGDNIIVTLPGSGTNVANITDGAGNTNIAMVGADIQAINGVIHTINRVLLPSN